MTRALLEVFIAQGVVTSVFAIGSAIIIAKINAVHKLVNSRSEAQDAKISLLTAQLAAQGLLLTAAETASKHSEGNN